MPAPLPRSFSPAVPATTEPPLPLCGWCGAPARPVGSRLLACAACGAATTFPAPDDAELEDAYADWYRPDGGRFGWGGDRLLRRSRTTLARRLDSRARTGPVLDVGCGEGVLLDALRARGREAVGIERAAVRDDVRAQELTEFTERAGEWAGVVFWHSLEHLRQPGAALDRATELLAPGGLLVVAVPNRASWQARRFGARWFALDLPRHLVHVPAIALLDALRTRGLQIERISYWRGGQVMFGWLQGLVGSLPGRPDLYDAIRVPAAQRHRLSGVRRVTVLAAGIALAPAAAVLAVLEIAARAGGTVYVEARRP
jgi:SAM-dependent methyltransferase